MARPILETPRLRLRPLVTRDRVWLQELLADPAVRQFTRQPVRSRWAAWCAGCLSTFDERIWAIEERNTPAGLILAGSPPSGSVHPALSFELRRNFWHRGLATEAVQAVLQHQFEIERQPGLSGRCSPENRAALRVFEKAGFRPTGEDNFELSVQQWLRQQLSPPVVQALGRLDSGLPSLQTDRLLLRRAERADVVWLAEMRADHQVMKLMLDPPVAPQQALALEHRDLDRDTRRLVVADRRTGDAYGWVALGELVAVPNVTVGYALRRNAWGQGIAAEATRRLTQHALEALGFPEVEGVVFRENQRSRRVLEKAGFRLARLGLYAGRESAFYSLRPLQTSAKHPQASVFQTPLRVPV